jgi:hypothetical protein
MYRRLVEFFGRFPGLEHVVPDDRRARISHDKH